MFLWLCICLIFPICPTQLRVRSNLFSDWGVIQSQTWGKKTSQMHYSRIEKAWPPNMNIFPVMVLLECQLSHCMIPIIQKLVQISAFVGIWLCRYPPLELYHEGSKIRLPTYPPLETIEIDTTKRMRKSNYKE